MKSNRFQGRLCLSDRIALVITMVLVGVGLFSSFARATETTNRVVAIGGSITETVYALGEQDQLVARDTTSIYPPEAMDLPDVGYIRQLSPEGVLSVGPNLIVSEAGAGPAEAVALLREASIPFIEASRTYTREGVVDKILLVGEAMGVPEKAKKLADQVDADLRKVETEVAKLKTEPRRVLFILSTQGGRIMASGTGTSANAIIAMAGGQNAVTEFEGYKPVTAEAIAATRPDVILMMDRGGNHSTTNAELSAMPALQTTPAVQNEAIVRMNGLLLLGFGPRIAEAVQTLHQAIYGDT